MRVLVVYAHPSKTSFLGALHATACERLRRNGMEIDDLDLYEENFNPLLSKEALAHYLDVTANRGEVSGYVDRLLAADALVLIYPVWHDGVPAILKGFIDRVFLPGVAFEIGADGVFRPRLSRIRRMAAVATYGADRRRTVGIGDLPRRMFARNLCELTPRDSVRQYLAEYGMDRADAEQRARFLRRVARAFDKWR